MIPLKQCAVSLLILAVICPVLAVHGFGPVPDVRVRILVDGRHTLSRIHQLGFDPVSRHGDWLIMELTESELDRLRREGFQPEILSRDLDAERAAAAERGRDMTYHTYATLRQEMMDIAANHPSLAQFIVTGQSVQGRDIMTLKISDNVTQDEAEPEIRWDGTIHGDEKIAQEVAMYLVNELINFYGEDPQITQIVNQRELFFTPCVNPDGMEAFSRYNANGVDCNRDYGYMWAAEGGSSSPFSQPETRAILELIMNNQFTVGISGHSGTELMIHCWSYIWDPTWDHAQYTEILNQYEALSGYTGGGQSSHQLYYVNGSSKEADYGIGSGFGYTLEISYDKTPAASMIDDYCLINRNAALNLFQQMGNGIQGIVTDATTGEPIPALVEVVEIGWPVYADPVVGDYHRYVLPGTYSLRVWANDYNTVLVPDVAVPADGEVTVDVELEPAVGSYAYRVILCRDTQVDDNNHTFPADLLGPVDSEFYAIGVNGYIVVDMGETTPIMDYSGIDFTVWEGDATAEGYSVAVSNSWQGPWQSCGSGSGTMEFDLDGTGLESARFVKITDDGDGSPGALLPGFDLDAITTEHVPPGCGILELDRDMYGCESLMVIRLEDSDLNLNPGAADTAVVHLSSSSDPAGADIVLTETGPTSGLFEGTAQLSNGSGDITVTHGDTLTVTYADADCEGEPQDVELDAEIDCIGPVITGVSVAAITDTGFTVTWTTDEPADSTIWYGGTVPPVEMANLEMFQLQHQVTVTDLSDCTPYVYGVESADPAGNTTLENNGGSWFSLTTLELILFLDANMDTDPGWTYQGQWDWGQPSGTSGDPSSGYTGDNVVGYNLNGAYANGLPEFYLLTPEFDCSDTSAVTLSYWKWLGVESASYDHAALEISGNGGSSWSTIWEHTGGTVAPSEWEYREFDISVWAAGQSNVQLRWTMGPTDGSVVECGWNIDDVQIFHTAPCVPPTATPTATAEPTVSPTVTSTPEPGTPTPTVTPTDPAPTRTPTPECSELGVTVFMPGTYFRPGSVCACSVFVCNPGEPLSGTVPLFVILDVYGQYFFAPSFGGFDYYTISVPQGLTEVTVLGEFIWPAGAGSAANVFWHAAMTDPGITALMGGMDSWTFGWGD